MMSKKIIIPLVLLISFSINAQWVSSPDGNVTTSGSVGVNIGNPNNGWQNFADLFVNGTVSAHRIGWAPSDSFSFGTNPNFKIANYGMSFFNEKVGDIDRAPKIALSGYYGLKFFTSGKERINIDNIGNVGIGTTNPTEKLDVYGKISAKESFELRRATDNSKKIADITWYSPNNGLVYSNNNGGYHAFRNNLSGDMMRIAPNGNVGIGTTNPNEALVVKGSIGLHYNSSGAFSGIRRNGIKTEYYNGITGQVNEVIHEFTGSADQTIMSLTQGGNVGIGTVNPAGKLHVNGDVRTNRDFIISGTARLTKKGTNNARLWAIGNLELGANGDKNHMHISSATGNVGIGTSSPDMKLSVRSDKRNITRFHTTSSDVITGVRLGRIESYVDFVNTTSGFGISSGKNGANLALNTQNENNISLFINKSTKDVGIGTTDTKGYKLGVNGKIAATEVKVALYDNWSDFVFYDDYKLPTLKEVENHITEKGHLKDIPSAKEVAENGIFLGDMNAKLLQKIEELTLYTIAQEKEIEKLEESKNKEVKKLEEKSNLQDQKIELLIKRLEKLEVSK